MLRMSSEKYVDSSRTRPRKNESGGFGNYCCIPHCTSALYDSNRVKTGISLFKFPSDTALRKEWLHAIRNVRRKGGNDLFDPDKASCYICEFHFKAEDIRVTTGSSGRKKVIKGRIPSIFPNKSSEEPKKKRKSPAKRQPLETNVSSETEESIIESDDDEDYMDMPEPPTEVDMLREELESLKTKVCSLENDNKRCNRKIELLQGEKYRYENVSKDLKLFRSTTGLEKEAFDALFAFLDPGEDCSNIKLYDTDKRLSQATDNLEKLKPGPKPKHSSIEQFFMYLSWLRNGFTLSHTAWLFQLPVATASRHIITWSNLIYFSLGSASIWPTRAQVNETMPDCFKRTYPSTRCIIDCTELFCQRPSSLSTQSALYSHYKSHVTYKGLVGISPSGAITFISQLYDGSISDKEIVQRSGLLESELWEKGDSIMADRGFTIEDDLEPLGVHLNIPAFLRGRSQLTVAEVKESQTIASVRIHVERAIQRIKKFRVLRNEIPLTLYGSINQIWTVCCLLCNFLPPLIHDDMISDE